jgi:hypothetical protein
MGANIINAFAVENQTKSEPTLPPWLFLHPELIRSMAAADDLDRKKLTNILNYHHFKGNPAYVLLSHPKYNESILIKAFTEPCLGLELSCRWDENYGSYRLADYGLPFLILPHDQALIIVPTRLISRTENGFVIELPNTALVVSRRQHPRYECKDIKADLWQNGFHAEAELADFSPQAFRLRIRSVPVLPLDCFNSEEPSTISLSSCDHVYYSGICHCRREKQTGQGHELVFAPSQDRIRRFKSKALRNPRKQSTPPCYAIFDHPFMKKVVQREISDISTTGFAIANKLGESILMPGMMIPDMVITYAGILKIRCKVQVIYSKQEEDQARCGLTILDMDLKDYKKLNQLLNNIPGSKKAMTNEVDFDQLMRLFFEADFIYPDKYKHIYLYRELFQKTYKKLYSEDAADIAAHFTYQNDGHLCSHISVIRSYERTWMVHHHAAKASENIYTGLIVLKQMVLFLHDMHRLPSAHLDYYLCYYRPENKFTDRIYSGFFREKADPDVCSLDLFAYLSINKDREMCMLPTGWSFQNCSYSDLWEFERFYKHRSGGLLFKALSLDCVLEEKSLEIAYKKLDLVRRWKIFSLHYSGKLKALIIAEESDLALNLSDLLNGLKIFILDDELPSEILFSVTGNIAQQYPTETLPLLIYPADYAKANGLNVEKNYFMWCLDARKGNEFVKYLANRFRMSFA